MVTISSLCAFHLHSPNLITRRKAPLSLGSAFHFHLGFSHELLRVDRQLWRGKSKRLSYLKRLFLALLIWWDCIPCRKYVVWMSMLLLQAVLGVVETSGPLTDLGRPSRIQVLLLCRQYNSSWCVLLNSQHCREVGFLSDGGERHLCEGHRRIGFRGPHWDHVWTLRSPEKLQPGKVHLHVGPGERVGELFNI